MILPSFIEKIICRLEAGGFEAYIAGGAVRDYLLGHTPTDWDIATSALPSEVLELFGTDSCIPTGIKHGTVTLIVDNQSAEITTYRIDGNYPDNRHPETIRFTKNIIEDLSRRDFTVNAMAYNPQSGLLDRFGGRLDLNNKVIRAVGNPEERFSEDALRIMRALRFAAVLGFELEKHTRNAVHNCKGLLKNIAKERLQAEFSKLVTADMPGLILTEFTDVFFEIFGVKSDFFQDIWNENSKLVNNAASDLSVRLAVLLNGISKDMQPCKILKNLKYDNKTIYEVKILSDYLNFEIKPDPVRVKYILSELGIDMLRLVLAAKYAKYGTDLSDIYNIAEKIISANQCYSLKTLAVDGNTLKELGISGTEIGRILKLLLNEVIEEKCKNEKSLLAERAKELKKR